MSASYSPNTYTIPQVLNGLREEDLGRRRLQQKGDLVARGGWWRLRWRVDAMLANGETKPRWTKPVIIGPAQGNLAGLEPWTEKEARRYAWENFLSHVDHNVQTPQSVVTVREFVKLKFEPEHVALLKPSGRNHYGYMLPHALAAIGDEQLRDIRVDHIQRAVSAMLTKTYTVPRGKDAKGKPRPPLVKHYSVQTATHVRNVISAIFEHAITIGWHPGPNPAERVKLPEMERKERHALTFDQARAILASLPEMEHDLALTMVLTSMNVAEACGVQWRHVNLSDEFMIFDGEAVPPLNVAIRQQWYRGQYVSLKKKARKRNIPLPAVLVEMLKGMRTRKSFTAPDDPVFCSRNGTPIDEHNALARHVKPVGRKLGMPWISWHVFRRTNTTLADQMGASFADRMAVMGHADMRMTALYTVPDQDRRRALLDEMASKLMGEPAGGVQ